MPTTYTKNPLLKQPPGKFTKEDGWGADLDPKFRPMYPMELPSDVTELRGRVVPERMVPNIRIHKSTEHPDLTPVFGTTCPPRGLSGRIRDAAYVFSEGRISHWLLLLLADRIDVVEGIVEDLAHAKSPGYIRDRGFQAAVKSPGAVMDGATPRRRGVSYAGVALGVLAVAAVVGAAAKRR